MATFGEVLASRSGLSGVSVRAHLQTMYSVPSQLSPADVTLMSNAVLAALNATTIPVDAVTGAWPTAAQNADAVWSKQLP